jgi:hypothetical protein
MQIEPLIRAINQWWLLTTSLAQKIIFLRFDFRSTATGRGTRAHRPKCTRAGPKLTISVNSGALDRVVTKARLLSMVSMSGWTRSHPQKPPQVPPS